MCVRVHMARVCVITRAHVHCSGVLSWCTVRRRRAWPQMSVQDPGHRTSDHGHPQVP